MKAETTAELEAALQRQTQQHVSPIATKATCVSSRVVLWSDLPYASIFLCFCQVVLLSVLL